MFHAYIIQSIKSFRYYIGHGKNIQARLIRHNSGMVTATKNKGPWKLVYFESFPGKVEANRRELEIKSRKSRKYIEKLISDGVPDSYREGRHVPT